MTPRATRSATVSRHQDLQEALVVTAEAAVASGGLDKLRARALAEAVGCSVGAIYTVFPDMDALVLAVNARTLGAIGAAMAGVPAAGDPVQHLVRLALAYLAYASAHRRLWGALFQHTLGGQAAPDWYAAQQAAAFSHIEAPLAALRPDLHPAECAVLARSLFSAVHGMVALGLDEKVATLPLPLLNQQVRLVVEAVARGLAPDAARRPG